LQGNRFASNGYIFYHTVNVSYLKMNVQTFDIFSEFKMFKSFCGLNVQLTLAGVKFTCTLMKFSIL